MDKTALITGASRGFGLALTKAFAANRWQVIPVVRTDTAATLLHELPNCMPIWSDITSDTIQSAIRESLNDMGSIDVLINNAGIPGKGVRLDETTPEEVMALLDVHCLGALRVTQATMPYLAEDGIIINVSSRFGSMSKISKGELDDISCSYSYRIAKAAQNMLTQCMCREFNDRSVRICSIHPGRLKTDSGSGDADRTPEEAAQKLIMTLSTLEHGRFYSLFEDPMEW